MSGLTQIDLNRQAEDATLVKSKLKADFLDGADLDLTDGNNNATITGLSAGSTANDAVNYAQMNSAISAAIVGGMTYQGVIDCSVATGETLDGASKGDYYYVSVAGTLDGIAFNVGDHLVANSDITDFSVDGSGKIDIIDNTESSDILRNSDIINNLTTATTGDVLDASQGKVLKDKQDLQQTEIDKIETAAGFDANGDYITPSGTNYIDGSSTLAGADVLLDTAIKANEDAITAFGTEVWGESKTVTDGSPVLPALSNIPVKAGTARIYVNGMRQALTDDYAINETTGVITMTYNLKNPKDTVLVDYKY